MTSPTPTPSLPDPTARRIAAALVAADLIEAGARDRAAAVVAGALAGPVPIGRPPRAAPPTTGVADPPVPTGSPDVVVLRGLTPGRRRLAEALAYVGGSLVVSAVLLLIGRQWSALGFGERLTLLSVCTIVLGVAGAVIVARAGGRLTIREPGQEVWRRLASVLLTAAAATVAGIIGVLVDTMPRDTTGRVALSLAALVVAAAAAYLTVPSAAGQLTIGFGAVWCAASLASDLAGRNGPEAVGLSVLGVAGVWVLLAEARVWREVDLGRFLGCAGAFAGAQLLLLLADAPALGYTLTFLIGLGGFALHWARRAWPYLVLGVVALTASLTEAAMDWFDGSLGVAGGLPAAGLTLIGPATFALRLRQEQATSHAGRPGRPAD